jgi:hypothetical protein
MLLRISETFSDYASPHSICNSFGYDHETVWNTIFKEQSHIEVLSIPLIDVELTEDEKKTVPTAKTGKNKQIDLLLKVTLFDKVYYIYLELKGNDKLDTEKLPATITKVHKVASAIGEKLNVEVTGHIFFPLASSFDPSWPKIQNKYKAASILSVTSLLELTGCKAEYETEYFNGFNSLLSKVEDLLIPWRYLRTHVTLRRIIEQLGYTTEFIRKICDEIDEANN